MRAREYGTEHSQVVILLHGGGLGPWNYREEAERLKAYYHVVLPILDGHAGSDRSFSTIEENARALIEEIDERFGGQVLLIGGLSLGGQVLVEMLSQRKDICKYALIESALVRPRPITAALLRPAFSLCYPLVKLRWFAKLQSASLHINASYFEDYFADSAAIRKEDMIAFLTGHAGSVYVVDGAAVCKEAGSPKALNVALLGAACETGLLGLSLQDIQSAFEERLRPALHEMNRRALFAGARAVR